MPAFVPFPAAPGEVQQLEGFFTQALYLRKQPAQEVERRLGYRTGRLHQGYWLMFLTRLPTVDEFEYRGYSQMSDGIPQGHIPGNERNPNAEQSLRAGGYNLTGNATQSEGMKQKTLRQTFTLHGAHRLAKVRPVARAHNDPGIPDYPPGSGIPQWTLTKPLPWLAAAFIGPGEMYEGMYT